MTTYTHDRTVETDARTNAPADLSDGLSRRTTLGMIGLGALGMAASSPGRAAPDEQCFTVNGGIVEGQLTSETTTAGTLRGAGPLNGSTALAIEAVAPSAGLPGVPVDTLSYTGTFEITTNQGDLTLRDVGVFDSDISTDGEFASRGRVVGGTGRWEGATGVMFFFGDTGSDGTFAAEANGTVCIPKG